MFKQKWLRDELMQTQYIFKLLSFSETITTVKKLSFTKGKRFLCNTFNKNLKR